METNSDADAPLPATPDEFPAPELPLETPLDPEAEPAEASAEEVAGEEVAGEEVADEPATALAELVASASRGRLSAAEEERGTALLKELLQGGRAGVALAVAALPQLPWLVGIRAVETVWPELTAGFRTQLVSGLSKDETDGARRMRLSLARALFKLDPPVGLKIAVGVAKEMRDKESGMVAPKDAQMFSNVFIGRARPWVALLPLAELKPAEGDLLTHVALLVAFTLPHPPVTQLGVLKWVHESGRLAKLHEAALAAVIAGLGRWNAKWQNVLRKEVAELPEEILAALRPPAAEVPETAGDEQNDPAAMEEAPAGEEGADASPRRERPVYISRQEEARRKAIAEGTLAPDAEMPATLAEPVAREEDDEDEDEDEEEGAAEPRPARGGRDFREPREGRESRQSQGRHGQQFNLPQMLRQIESHVSSLKAELENAKSKLRNRDLDAERAARRKPDVPVIAGEPTPDELARLNRQLELRNDELQNRIGELTQHAEDMATASGALSDQPVTDPDAQLRALLALKLQEDYEDFCALEKEGNDVVVQQHYRTLIGHLFEVLLANGVPLKPGEGQ